MPVRSYWMYPPAKLLGIAAVFAALLVGPASAGAAAITVDSATDDGTGCTLREAISSADNNSDQGGCVGVSGYGNDTILFANGLTGPITLNGTELQIGTFAAGTLDIQGPGADQLTVDGANASRVFNVLQDAGATTISGLTITHGRVNLTLPAPQADGAGVRSRATVTLDNDRITANSVVATSNNSSNGFAAALGAGVFNASGTLTVNHSVVDQNTATATATSGSASDVAIMEGAGIASSNGPLTVSFTTVSGNTSTETASGGSSSNFAQEFGIGIYSGPGGSQNVDHSLVAANTGGAGGAGAAATSSGGGIYTATGTEIDASTIVNNAPVATTAQGGGVFIDHDTGLTSDTLTGNSANSGGANLFTNAGTATVQNAVLAEHGGTSSSCGGTIASSGHNISDDASCNLVGTGDLPSDTNVNLLPLGDYGGPTQTRPPSAFPSNAPSDTIDTGVVAGQGSDQRGFTRTWQFDVADGAGDGTDIGAAELQGPRIDGTSPGSPADDAQPKVSGFAEDVSDVKLYTTSDCSGLTHGQGATTAFVGSGITVSPPLASNTSTTFYATSTIGTITSECSTPFSFTTYIRNPVMPVLTSTTPASGSNDNNPRILGSADSTATVNLYKTPTCTGTIAGTGSGADLASPGIAVTVPDNSTTTFYAQATGISGTDPSACSSGRNYTEVTPPPTPTPSPAPAPSPGATTPTKKKCKKAKKRSAQVAKKKCKKKRK